ncbi:type IV pilin-like G/H family protein [Crocosphaera sp.]|uniref:type IV pilin-like G/H family protein n=1 Tax=Crocosphaera sp. TaxID=2729996 RepID=UPI0026112C0D|nr:type IV pilin-like G/H family protein [Crocosphaera sp.]MDJ0581818.1 type IV pilin-like G/H family protein [Crocosphaera sp.]
MVQALTNKQRWLTATVASLLLGTSLVAIPVQTQAEEQVEQQPVLSEKEQVKQAQAKALEIITKMTAAQRSYHEENGEFEVVIDKIAEDHNLTLPSTFNYAVRTSFQGAYIYVQPSDNPIANKLTGYVGGVFMKSPEKAKDNETQKGEIVTIICQTKETGRRRPADPRVARPKDSSSTSDLSLSCADSTVPVRNN